MLHEIVDIPLQTQPEGILELDQVPEGTWLAEWVNTVTAETFREELVEAREGKLILYTPLIEESIALRLEKF